MGNMSYCRFQNTVIDLDDCYDNIDDTDNMSDEELRARKKLIKICCDIALDFGDEIDMHISED
jgi:hypothetical protein